MKAMHLLAGLLVILAGASLVAAYEQTQASCYSIRESKVRGVFVCSLSLAPDIVSGNGKTKIVREAWLERNFKWGAFGLTTHSLPGYRICFALEKNLPTSHYFTLAGRSGSFSHINAILAFDTVDNIEAAKATVTMTGPENSTTRIEVTPKVVTKKR